MKDYFDGYHPIVNMLYFVSVIGCGMFFLHPIYMVISLSAAVAYSVLLCGTKALRFNLCGMLPMMLVVACINPVFNHKGVTILFYLKNGNPFTLESVIYGVVSSAMLITVVIWFSCYNQIMSSDKLMYLFGRIMPALSLIFAMSLRFVPLYKKRIQLIIQAQEGIGIDVSQGKIMQRIKNGGKVLSIMTTWALENAIETSDSMKARGYGLKNRTAFSYFVFTKRDGVLVGVMSLCLGVLMWAALYDVVWVQYLPSIKISESQWQQVVAYSVYGLLCYLPIMINGMEAIKWKYFISRI